MWLTKQYEHGLESSQWVYYRVVWAGLSCFDVGLVITWGSGQLKCDIYAITGVCPDRLSCSL
jgi:hypothetical protein